MAFMVPIAERMAVYHVETSFGTELVPENVCGTLNPDGLTPYESCATVEALRPYLQSDADRIHSVERKEGWYARLSAPGYLDCTEWDGPYPTEGEALGAVQDFYDVDANGDPND